MTTHCIIATGRPKLPVISGNAMLTAVSSGTTDVPTPTRTRRNACRGVIGSRCAIAEGQGVSFAKCHKGNDKARALLHGLPADPASPSRYTAGRGPSHKMRPESPAGAHIMTVCGAP